MRISPRPVRCRYFLLALVVAPHFAVAAHFAPARAQEPRAQNSPVQTSAACAEVTLKVSTDESRYTPGQPLLVQLTTTNTARRPVDLHFTSGQRFDFSIYAVGQSDPVYTWSATRLFLQALGSLRLQPGQSQHYEASAGVEMGLLKPGKYRLLAHLTNTPLPIRAAPITLEVVDLHLAVTAHTDKARYRIGESVRIDVAVANLAAKVNRVPFDSGLAFDVFITDASENPVWNYGANLRFIHVLGAVTWQKGETKTYAALWNGVPLPRATLPPRLEPGRYRVQAVLQSTPRLYAAPVYIDILP